MNRKSVHLARHKRRWRAPATERQTAQYARSDPLETIELGCPLRGDGAGLAAALAPAKDNRTSIRNKRGGEMNLFDLSGKVALITGSTKGIGEAIAHRMAEHGAKVVVSSRKADACDKVAAEINKERGAKVAVPIPSNITTKKHFKMLVKKTRKQLGKIDILVCNAALNPAYGPMSKIADEAFDKILGANIRSNHWLAQMVLPDMIEKKD